MSKEMQVVFITDINADNNSEFFALMSAFPDAVLIDWYTMDVQELSFIAKHRVLPAKTILILHGTKVVCRIVNDLPSKDMLSRIVDMIKADS